MPLDMTNDKITDQRGAEPDLAGGHTVIDGFVVISCLFRRR
jgi:hypothetical protein